jgi:hypothetical protein
LAEDSSMLCLSKLLVNERPITGSDESIGCNEFCYSAL